MALAPEGGVGEMPNEDGSAQNLLYMFPADIMV